jgi:hypothetical protein
VLFFGTLLATGGTFLYKSSITASLAFEQSALASERSRFSTSDFESVQELAQQIDFAKDLMNKHVSVVSIFDALEKSAVQTLRFKEFSYKREQDGGTPSVRLAGESLVINDILFQRDVLASNPVLAAAVFKEVGIGVENPDATEQDQVQGEQIIQFVLASEVNPSTIPYTPPVAEVSSSTATAEDEGIFADEFTEETDVIDSDQQ